MSLNGGCMGWGGDMEYRVFTSMLANRERIIKSIAELKVRLEVLEYEETGVKGVSYTKAPISHNPSLSALKRLDLVDKVDDLKREINFLSQMIEETEIVLSRMPEELQTMLLEKFVKGMTYTELGNKYGYTNAGMLYVLKKETEKYL